MKKRRLKPQVFLRAAAKLQQQLDDPYREEFSFCCNLIGNKTPEAKLFTKLFKPKHIEDYDPWFGGAYKTITKFDPSSWYGVTYTRKLVKANQNRRIQAMLFCYEVAKRVR